MKILTFIANNWYFIIAFLSIIGFITILIRDFSILPSQKKIAKIKEWLKIAVDGAEKSIGSGNGEMKLNLVYTWFVKRFPFTSIFISFELFKKLVDEALGKISDVLE